MFGLQYRMALSTRPEKYMGSPELWAKAEASLEDALNASGQQWEVRPADCLPKWSAFNASLAALPARMTDVPCSLPLPPAACCWIGPDLPPVSVTFGPPIYTRGCRLQILQMSGELAVLAEVLSSQIPTVLEFKCR